MGFLIFYKIFHIHKKCTLIGWVLLLVFTFGSLNLFAQQVLPANKERQCPLHKFKFAKDGKTIVKVGKVWQPIETFFFDNGSFKLNQIQLESLNGTIGEARQKGLIIYLEGYADDKGDEDYNQQLSERRVKVIAEYLEKGGLNPDQIRTICFGKIRYKKSAAVPHNRRVVISVEIP